MAFFIGESEQRRIAENAENDRGERGVRLWPLVQQQSWLKCEGRRG